MKTPVEFNTKAVTDSFDKELIEKVKGEAAIAAEALAVKAREIADKLNKDAASITDKKLRKSIYTGV